MGGQPAGNHRRRLGVCSARTEEIARFGQLYLQKGRWNGRQLIPAAWVDGGDGAADLERLVPTSDWDQGYGYQFWRSRHDSYRGDGAFGQYCIVMPELDAVVAITSGVRDMQARDEPRLGQAAAGDEGGAAARRCRGAARSSKAKLAGLTVRLPAGQRHIGARRAVSGSGTSSPRTTAASRRWRSISTSRVAGAPRAHGRR